MSQNSAKMISKHGRAFAQEAIGLLPPWTRHGFLYANGVTPHPIFRMSQSNAKMIPKQGGPRTGKWSVTIMDYPWFLYNSGPPDRTPLGPPPKPPDRPQDALKTQKHPEPSRTPQHPQPGGIDCGAVVVVVVVLVVVVVVVG